MGNNQWLLYQDKSGITEMSYAENYYNSIDTIESQLKLQVIKTLRANSNSQTTLMESGIGLKSLLAGLIEKVSMI